MMLAQVIFNPEVTLGNLAQIVTIISVGLGFWFKLREEINLLKQRLDQVEKRHDELLADFRKVTRIELNRDK